VLTAFSFPLFKAYTKADAGVLIRAYVLLLL